MTTYGDQVFQYGGVPVDSGGNRRVQMFQAGNIWFVDGDDGLSGATGLRPNDAVKSITEVLALPGFGRMATIYIKPKTTAGSAQSYYQDSVDIPVTATGLSILGAGNTGSLPNVRGGVQYKPTTAGVTDNLFTVAAGSVWFDNMRLTLNGGTASSYASTIYAVNSAAGNADGLTVTNCLFEAQKDHPGLTGGAVDGGPIGAIAVNAGQVRIENNFFYGCLGGITIHSFYGSPQRMLVRGNQFAGNPANRDADMIISINSASADGIVVDSNLFADGLPAHSDGGQKRFIKFPYLTAGTGILSNNYFACISNEAQFAEAGTQAILADNFFAPGNWSRGSGTTAPYGIVTDT